MLVNKIVEVVHPIAKFLPSAGIKNVIYFNGRVHRNQIDRSICSK